jgi:small-conductance mechanosensitive channel
MVTLGTPEVPEVTIVRAPSAPRPTVRPMEPALPPGDDDETPRVVDLRARRAAGGDADEQAALAGRLAAVEAERDRLAAELRDAQSALQGARPDLAPRAAAEASVIEEAAAVQGELAAERARASRTETALRRQMPAPAADAAALAAARDRVRAATDALPAPSGLAADLDRAAERLRMAAPEPPQPTASNPGRRLLRRLLG